MDSKEVERRKDFSPPTLRKTFTMKFAEEAEKLREGGRLESSTSRSSAEELARLGLTLGGPAIWVPKRHLSMPSHHADGGNPSAAVQKVELDVASRFEKEAGHEPESGDANQHHVSAGGPATWSVAAEYMGKPGDIRAEAEGFKDGFKVPVPRNPVKKENRAERYKELRATGQAVQQHVELLMKHTDVLICGSEQLLPPDSVVAHSVQLRQELETGTAGAADVLAGMAVEYLTSYRKLLRSLVPSVTFRDSPESANGEVPDGSKLQQTASQFVSRQQLQQPNLRAGSGLEKDTSLTLACGGSFAPSTTGRTVISPSDSGESGGGSICEDDASGQLKANKHLQAVGRITATGAATGAPAQASGHGEGGEQPAATDRANPLDHLFMQALDAKLSPMESAAAIPMLLPSPVGQLPVMSQTPRSVDDFLKELQAFQVLTSTPGLHSPFHGFPPLPAPSPQSVSLPSPSAFLNLSGDGTADGKDASSANPSNSSDSKGTPSSGGEVNLAFPPSSNAYSSQMIPSSFFHHNFGAMAGSLAASAGLNAFSFYNHVMQSETASQALAALIVASQQQELLHQQQPDSSAPQVPDDQVTLNQAPLPPRKSKSPELALLKIEPVEEFKGKEPTVAQLLVDSDSVHPFSSLPRTPPRSSTPNSFEQQAAAGGHHASPANSEVLRQEPSALELEQQQTSVVFQACSTVTKSLSEEGEGEDEEEVEAKPVLGKRNASPEPTTAVKRQRSRQQEEEVPGDTWHWRKYGQKVIKDTPLYRSYYRCGCRKGTVCTAKRHVDRYLADNKVASVVYEGEHSHPKPPPKNRTMIVIRDQPESAAAEAATEVGDSETPMAGA